MLALIEAGAAEARERPHPGPPPEGEGGRGRHPSPSGGGSGWGHARPDLQRVIDRHALTLDATRPEAVAKRHALGRRTARENIADLCDAGQLHRVRRAGGRRADAPPQRSTTWSPTRRPTAWSPASAASTARCSAPERVALRGDGLRRHRAGRHAGHAQPPEDRPHAGHRAASTSCRWCCSPKAAAAGPATPTCPSSPACTSPPSPASRRCRARCRWSASWPAAASPATRRCSAAAT